MDAARAILREGGLDALQVSAVARRAGVTRPTVYRRFADGQALAIAVLHDDLERVAVQASRSVPRDRPILEQLLALVAPIYDYYAEHPAISRALLQLAFFGPYEPDDPLQVQLALFLGDVGARIEEAVGRGELSDAVDVPTLVAAFFGLYVTTAMTIIQGMVPDGAAALALLERLLRQHLRGL